MLRSFRLCSSEPLCHRVTSSKLSLCLRSRLRIALPAQERGHFLCPIILTPLQKCDLGPRLYVYPNCITA